MLLRYRPSGDATTSPVADDRADRWASRKESRALRRKNAARSPRSHSCASTRLRSRLGKHGSRNRLTAAFSHRPTRKIERIDVDATPSSALQCSPGNSRRAPAASALRHAEGALPSFAAIWRSTSACNRTINVMSISWCSRSSCGNLEPLVAPLAHIGNLATARTCKG